jgi:hypothetical protein
MLSDLPRMHGAIQGVGFMFGQQRPFLGFLAKNWPLALIAGFAMYGKVRERHKKGDLNAYNALADLGLVLSPLVGLALLNQLAQQEQDRKNAAAGQVAPQPAPLYPQAPQ